MLKTRKLELENAKLEIELERMEKNYHDSLNNEDNQDTTIYLHTS